MPHRKKYGKPRAVTYVKVRRRFNGVAVPVPKEILRAAGIRASTHVKVTIAAGRITVEVRPGKATRPRLRRDVIRTYPPRRASKVFVRIRPFRRKSISLRRRSGILSL